MAGFVKLQKSLTALVYGVVDMNYLGVRIEDTEYFSNSSFNNIGCLFALR